MRKVQVYGLVIVVMLIWRARALFREGGWTWLRWAEARAPDTSPPLYQATPKVILEMSLAPAVDCQPVLSRR